MRKVDPERFELHPSDVAAKSDMAPRFYFMRPQAVLGHLLAALMGVVVVSAGYDNFYESSSNKLVPVVGDFDVTAGGSQLVQFGSDASPLSPLMRWLRVSVAVYPQVRPECTHIVGNLSAACFEVPPSVLSLRSSILKRDRDADEWEPVAGGELVRVSVVCPTSISSSHHPAYRPDPLALGSHSHCDVFSVAFRAAAWSKCPPWQCPSSAAAPPRHLLAARLVVPCSSALPGWAPASAIPARASAARASCLQSR